MIRLLTAVAVVTALAGCSLAADPPRSRPP